MAIPDGELCERYEALYPAAVTDTLDEMGYGRRTLPTSIEPLRPEARMAGIAFPLVGHPVEAGDYEENIRRFLEMLGDAPEHGVLAYETNDEDAAHIGELTTTALAERGCRGAVMDGGARDVRYIREQGFPVFCEYTTPKDAPPRWYIDDWGVPVTIGEVEVRPGDVLVGDADGVACVPRDVAEEVLTEAEAMVDSESEIRELVREGVDPLDAFEEHGEF